MYCCVEGGDCYVLTREDGHVLSWEDCYVLRMENGHVLRTEDCYVLRREDGCCSPHQSPRSIIRLPLG